MSAQEIYKYFTEQPYIQTATFLSETKCLKGNNSIPVEVEYLHHCHTSDKKIKSNQVVHFSAADLLAEGQKDIQMTLSSPLYQINENLKISKLSPSRKLKFLAFESNGSSNDAKKDSKRWIEIWNGENKILTKVVTEIHGSYYTDDILTGFSWSHDESKIVYIAEEYIKEPETIEKYIYKEDWGEKYTGKRRSVMVVLSITTGLVAPILNHTLSASQPVFANGGESICFVGYSAVPRTYGLYACPNRKNGLYMINMDGSNLRKLTNDSESVQTPRIHPNFPRAVFYFTHKIGGPHAGAFKFVKMNLDTSDSTVLVDSIDHPKTNNDFPGFFHYKIIMNPCYCEENDDNYFVVTSSERFRETILSIHLTDGSVKNLTPKSFEGSWTLLDASASTLLALQYNFNSTPKLYVGNAYKNKVEWKLLKYPDETPVISSFSTSINADLFGFIKDNMQMELIDLSKTVNGKHLPLEALFVFSKDRISNSRASEKKDSAKIPLIICAHGGPHSAYVKEWCVFTSGLISLGFAFVFINYTGSTGYGQGPVDELVGKIGSLDIAQVHEAAKYVLQKFSGLVDDKNVFYLGGSHGGFIGSWLSVLYPDFYKAVVLLNPAIDKIGSQATSDIPDWGYYEAGLSFDFSSPKFPNLDELKVMYYASAVSHVNSTPHLKCSPTLMVIGMNDRRVHVLPNAVKWHHMLKGKGQESRLYQLPETGHSLEGVLQERENFNIISSFLLEKLSPELRLSFIKI